MIVTHSVNNVKQDYVAQWQYPYTGASFVFTPRPSRFSKSGARNHFFSHLNALLTGCSRKGAWRMSKVKWVMIAMPNAYFDKLGLFLPGPRSA